jgi:hypothetical protein
MPQHDPGVYLEDIEHYAAAAVRFTSPMRCWRKLKTFASSMSKFDHLSEQLCCAT